MRGWIGEGFAHVGQRLDVHVLVTDHQIVKIAGVIGKILASQMLALSLLYLCQIGEGIVAIGQVKIPARVVCNGTGIPKRIGAGDQWGLPVTEAERPIFVEPPHMTNFPQHRIDDVELQAHQLFGRQPVDQAVGSRSHLL
jgi:hypothetical protein